MAYRVSSVIANNQTQVFLQIGSHNFITSKKTLTERDSGSLLAELAQSSVPDIFVDRDGTHFRYILNYLRDGTVVITPDRHVFQELLIEAKYYGLFGLQDILQRNLDSLDRHRCQCAFNSGPCLGHCMHEMPKIQSMNTQIANVNLTALPAVNIRPTRIRRVRSSPGLLTNSQQTSIPHLSLRSGPSRVTRLTPPSKETAIYDAPAFRSRSMSLSESATSRESSRSRDPSLDNKYVGYTDKLPNTFSWEEIATHNTRESCWLVSHGKVYDATPFLTLHPAGVDSILRKGGTDATEDFDFHSSSAKKGWKKYRIGTVEKDGLPCTNLCSIM